MYVLYRWSKTLCPLAKVYRAYSQTIRLNIRQRFLEHHSGSSSGLSILVHVYAVLC